MDSNRKFESVEAQIVLWLLYFSLVTWTASARCDPLIIVSQFWSRIAYDIPTNHHLYISLEGGISLTTNRILVDKIYLRNCIQCIGKGAEIQRFARFDTNIFRWLIQSYKKIDDNGIGQNPNYLKTEFVKHSFFENEPKNRQQSIFDKKPKFAEFAKFWFR